jgi:hypothetical protein
MGNVATPAHSMEHDKTLLNHLAGDDSQTGVANTAYLRPFELRFVCSSGDDVMLYGGARVMLSS